MPAISGTWALYSYRRYCQFSLSPFLRIGNGHSGDAGPLVVFHIIGRIELFEHLRPYFFTHRHGLLRDVFKPGNPLAKLRHYSSIWRAYVFGILLIGRCSLRSEGHSQPEDVGQGSIDRSLPVDDWDGDSFRPVPTTLALASGSRDGLACV